MKFETASKTEEQREPCPTPLAWSQVLERFRDESHAWELDRGEYVLRGRTWGDGPPLYFLPDWIGTYELLSLTIFLLREQFRCVVVDYPSYSARTGRPLKLSLPLLSSDVTAAADLHGDARFNLYAASFGSVVALQLLLDQPQRIGRTILQSGFARRVLTLSERLLIRIGTRLPGRLSQAPFRQALQQASHRAWFPPFDVTRWQFFLENTGQVPIAVLAQRLAVSRDADLLRELPHVRRPVILLQTEGQGRVADRCRAELEAGLPNVSTETLDLCGVLPYLTHPHRLAKLIRSLLQPPEPSVVESPPSS
jgi:pimeloyl-ACP methyl ester carboxylesterase